MVQERFILTRAGYEELKRELVILEERYKREIADLSELMTGVDPESADGSYFEAKNAKEQTEDRMNHLKRVINYADIADEDPDPSRVDPGDRVTVWSEADKETLHFDLLGSEEVSFGREGVSIESPVGSALLGRKIGDVVEVKIPDGVVRYKISNIERIPASAA